MEDTQSSGPFDPVPLDFGSRGSGLALAAYEELKKHLGVETPSPGAGQSPGAGSHRQIDPRSILDRYPVRVHEGREILEPYRRPNPAEDTFVDEWGATLKRPTGRFLPVSCRITPIKEPTLDAIKRHAWLDPDDPTRYEGLRRLAEELFRKGVCRWKLHERVFRNDVDSSGSSAGHDGSRPRTKTLPCPRRQGI